MGAYRELDDDLLRRLLDAAPDATVIVDQDATIVYANRHVQRVLGWEHDELVGHPVEILVPSRFSGAHPMRRDHFLASRSDRPMNLGMTLYAQHHDGHEVPVEISLSPLHTDSGVLVTASLRDITDRIEVQRQADRLRDDLVATVSHELRTPLASILGYTELLADLDESELGPQARRFVEIIDRNTQRELRLVDDLLTMAFLDDDRLKVRITPIDLHAVVTTVLEEQTLRARQAGLELVVDAEPVAPVAGDHYRLVQVLENLVTNAVKFTPAGGRVTLRVRDGHDGSAHLDVVDTGVGVEPHEVPRLFERLYRTPSAIQAHTRGAGLGLAIVKRIVEAHHGTIAVESSPGQGTTVHTTIPFADGAARSLGG